MEAIATNGGTNSNIASKKGSALSTIRDLLEQAMPRLAQVTPKHLTAERMVRIAVAAASRNPLLLQCTPQSVLGAVMSSAQLGLEPGGPLGHAHLVPYKNNKTGTWECQFIPGYRGLVELAYRSGMIATVEAEVVYERDKFAYKRGLNPVLDHEPDLSDNPGALRAVYAIARFKDGNARMEVMGVAKIEAIRKRSKSGDKEFSPWKTDYAEMAKKTVLRRICKTLPSSSEISRVLEIEDRVESSDIGVVDLPEEQAEPTKTEKVKNKVLAQLASAEPANEEPPHDPETGEVFDFEGPEPGSNG